MKQKPIKCIVACTNANGEPDLYFVKVECNDVEYSDGDHYARAEHSAIENGYERPFVTFDQHDAAGKTMLPLFNWNAASTV